MTVENRIYYIRSKDRISGSPNSFTIDLGGARGQNLVGAHVSLLDCQIPRSFYAIDETHNKVYVQEWDSVTFHNFTITVPPGEYKPSDLALKLKELLDTSSALPGNHGFTHTVDYVASTAKYTFTQGAGKFLGFDFTLTNSPMNDALGYPKDYISAVPELSNTSINVINLVKNKTLLLVSPDIATSSYHSNLNSTTRILGKIPINVSFGQTIEYENPNPQATSHKIRDLPTGLTSFEVRSNDGNLIEGLIDYTFSLLFQVNN
jgi:hypothetical protein